MNMSDSKNGKYHIIDSENRQSGPVSKLPSDDSFADDGSLDNAARQSQNDSQPPPVKKKNSLFPARSSIFPARSSIFPARPSRFPERTSDMFRGSPSVPPEGFKEIVVSAPREMRFLMVGLLISIMIFSVFYWDSFGVVNQKLVLFFNLMLFTGAVDYFQKVYVFKGNTIERRILFKWFKYPLPDSFSVKRELSGGIILLDDATERVILAIGRDLVNEDMTSALKELYQYSESSLEIG